MVFKEIAKEEIKGWSLGNVVIKTFSFGDKIKMASNVKRIFKTTPNVNETDDKIFDNVREDADLAEVNMNLIASGLHTVRNFDGMTFIIRPDSSKEEKMKFVYDIDFDSGKFLLQQIMLLNKPISDDEKKESSLQSREGVQTLNH